MRGFFGPNLEPTDHSKWYTLFLDGPVCKALSPKWGSEDGKQCGGIQEHGEEAPQADRAGPTGKGPWPVGGGPDAADVTHKWRHGHQGPH